MANRRDEFTFGASPAVRRMLDDCADFAPSHYPILLTGETGTGKTWLARYIHQLSGRRGPFIPSAIPQVEELAQGQLFGHEKGAFTGATEARSGYLELANGGTLFLDEVGTAVDAVGSGVSAGRSGPWMTQKRSRGQEVEVGSQPP